MKNKQELKKLIAEISEWGVANGHPHLDEIAKKMDALVDDENSEGDAEAKTSTGAEGNSESNPGGDPPPPPGPGKP